MVLNPDLLTLKSQPFLPDPIDNTEYPQHAIPHTGAGDGPAPESHLTARREPQNSKARESSAPGTNGALSRKREPRAQGKRHRHQQRISVTETESFPAKPLSLSAFIQKGDDNSTHYRAVACPKGAGTSEVMRPPCLVHSQHHRSARLVITFQDHIMSGMVATKRCPKLQNL